MIREGEEKIEGIDFNAEKPPVDNEKMLVKESITQEDEKNKHFIDAINFLNRKNRIKDCKKL